MQSQKERKGKAGGGGLRGLEICAEASIQYASCPEKNTHGTDWWNIFSQNKYLRYPPSQCYLSASFIEKMHGEEKSAVYSSPTQKMRSRWSHNRKLDIKHGSCSTNNILESINLKGV